MVLTVPDIAIIGGLGYRMSYGETTKRAPESSVFNHQRSHKVRWGREYRDPNRPVLMLLADGFNRWIRWRFAPSMPSSSIARARARRLWDTGSKAGTWEP
jgi:hypothetical protein